jgi:hypothetical protein
MLEVRVLKSRGLVADRWIAGGEYGTALQAASSKYTGNLKVIKLLLEKGADVNAQGTSFVIPRICS